MFQASQLFFKRVRESGRRKTVVDLIYDGLVIATDIPVEGGSITIDSSRAVRRTGSIVIPEKKLVPIFQDKGGPLAPYGTQIRIRQGLVYARSEELVPIGTFILDTTGWDEAEGPIPTIDFSDKAMPLERSEVGTPLDLSGWRAQYSLNVTISSYYGNTLAGVPGPVIYHPSMSNPVNPGGTTFNPGTKILDVIQQMARNCGGEFYFDVLGNPNVAPVPLLQANVLPQHAVWEFNVGEEGVLVNASREITRDDVYNVVVVIGQAQKNGKLVYAKVQDNDSASPTKAYGPFGIAVKSITDESLTTTAQCESLAQRKLDEYKRLNQSLTFSAVANPALDVGDIVLFTYPSGDKQVGMIESLTIPLGEGLMTGKCSVARFE